MGSPALAADMHTKAQANKQARFGRAGNSGPNVVQISRFEKELLKVPNMNGFGVEGPRGLKSKKPAPAPEKKDTPEQGRKYKDPNWWTHQRMMM